MCKVLGSSFRDPAGFVYRCDDVVLRQINDVGARDYEALMGSGLYDELVGRGLLIPHKELPPSPAAGSRAYKTIEPELIPYVSYPYEWCFSQLKEAALLTLRAHELALEHGLALKDASAYNVQFIGSEPIFIDTLSFERFEEGRPWQGYRQFCQHFLAPLLLSSYRDVRLRHLLRGMIDGVPLDLVSQSLPLRSYLRWSTLSHVHMHSRSQRRHGNDGERQRISTSIRVTKPMHFALVSSLRSAVESCAPPSARTEWSDYYSETNYTDEAMTAKEKLVAAMTDDMRASDRIVHDIGANTGRFSRLLARRGAYVISHDVDDMAVERNYREHRPDNARSVLPLHLDINNPSPALGWALSERDSFLGRARGQSVLALALIHHIAIANNVPLERIAAFFAQFAKRLLVEFVPKEDSQVQRLLFTREDIFPDYDIDHFRRAFCEHYDVKDVQRIPSTCRLLFSLMRRD